jgi:hypothetical protein
LIEHKFGKYVHLTKIDYQGDSMYKVTKYPQGTFSWADCSSTDVNKAKDFYTKLMDWETEDLPMGGGLFYTFFKKDGETVSAIAPMMQDMQDMGIPSHWNNYVTVDDVDALESKAKELGGTVIAPPFDVFDSGRMMTVQDPTGANISFWQPQNHIGASLVNTVGAMMWNELATRERDKAMAFYKGLLGWEFEKQQGQEYHLIKNNGRNNGGIMPIDESWGDAPSNWMTYFHVADIEASTKKVTELGGKVIVPITQAGEIGRFSVIADPAGAVVTIMQAQVETWSE